MGRFVHAHAHAHALALLLALSLPAGALAQDQEPDEEPSFQTSLDYAQVEEVTLTPEGDGRYAFAVTVRHDDQGWDHYADAWEVVDPASGEVLGTRELLHPHVEEQPFTRRLGGVEIPEDVQVVAVRAKCNVHGYGGREVEIDLSEPEGESYQVLD